MKRNLLTALLLLGAGPFVLSAREPAKTPAGQELNLQNFWFNSYNAAALSFSPLDGYSDLHLSYNREQGAFKHALDCGTGSVVTATTSGATEYKGFVLYGDFSYINSFYKDCLYNANRYEPSFEMPYYLADWNLSDWKKQCYDMGLKLAAPILAGGRLATGVEIRYDTRTGAKQMDPRAVSTALNLLVAPSVAYSPDGANTFGLTLEYELIKERTRHSTENYLVDQPVAIMRGLGYYTQGSVGGNLSVANYLYSGNRAGAALEWSHDGASSDLFSSLHGGYEKTTVLERPTFPQMRGATGTVFGDVAFKAKLGPGRSHRISFEGNFSRVTGYEYIQELVTSPKREWRTISIVPASHYLFAAGVLSYDYYSGAGADGYNWRAGALVSFDMSDQTYSMSYFSNIGVDASLRGAYNIALSRGVSLLASANAGYRLPISGEYFYSGSVNTSSAIVTGFYPSEIDYLTSQAVHAGAGLTCSLPVTGKTNLYFKADADFRAPLEGGGNRFAAALTIGTLF